MEHKIFLLLGVLTLVIPNNGFPNVKGRTLNLQIPSRLRHVPQNKLDDTIKQLLEDFREVMRNGLPELGIPVLDPLSIPHLALSTNRTALDIDLTADNVLVQGLSDYDVTKVKTNMIALSLELAFWDPNFRVDGRYWVDGTAGVILPVFGDGGFNMSITNITAGGGGKLSVFGDTISIKNLNIALDFEDLAVYFENLLGGGDFGDEINDIANDLGLELYHAIGGLIHDPLCSAMETFLNSALASMSLGNMTDPTEAPSASSVVKSVVAAHPKLTSRDVTVGNVNEYLDIVLAEVRKEMIAAGYDLFPLPDQVLEFDQEIMWVNWHGEASLRNGYLSGLQTVHRGGDATLYVDPNTGITSFETVLSYDTMALGYDVEVSFMDIGPNFKVYGSVGGALNLLKCHVEPDTRHVIVDSIDVTEVGHISIDVDELLGPFDFLIEMIADVIANLMRGIVAQFMEGTMEEVMQKVFDNFLFPEGVF